MKIKRCKQVRKTINFYVNYFNFRPPYQILLDGTFCFAALNNQINISDNIPKYLQNTVKLLTTRCVINEIEKLGKKLSGASIILKKFGLHKCGHEENNIPALECLLAMAGQKNVYHYIFATQDNELQARLRLIPGVPLLYLHQKTPVLEHPSNSSINTAKNIKEKTFSLTDLEKKLLYDKEELTKFDSTTKHKRNKRKGPNPLSTKKKKNTNFPIESKIKKNVIRKKNRFPKHLKELIVNNNMMFY